MNLVYKKASAEDVNTLINLEKSNEGSRTYSGTFEIDEWLEEIRNGSVYIIEKDGVAVGDVSYEMKSPDCVNIGRILIIPEFQGQDIARCAMKYIVNEIREVKRIDLVTHPDNYKAIGLYESFGFVIESRKENYFGDSEPRLIMTLVKETDYKRVV